MYFRHPFEAVVVQAGGDQQDQLRTIPYTPIRYSPVSIGEIADAFDTLLYFAKGFYNSTVYKFTKTGADFME